MVLGVGGSICFARPGLGSLCLESRTAETVLDRAAIANTTANAINGRPACSPI